MLRQSTVDLKLGLLTCKSRLHFRRVESTFIVVVSHLVLVVLITEFYASS
jgi:hypothetical protein